MAKGILKKPPDSLAKKIIGDKNDRHDLLIAEFKQAHRRMFAAASAASYSSASSAAEMSESESDSGPLLSRRGGVGGVIETHSSEGDSIAVAAVETTVLQVNSASGEKASTTSLLSDGESRETGGHAATGGGKPKAPPPPPPVKTSRLLSAQLSSGSSESLLSNKSMSTFKPDR